MNFSFHYYVALLFSAQFIQTTKNSIALCMLKCVVIKHSFGKLFYQIFFTSSSFTSFIHSNVIVTYKFGNKVY